MEKVKVIQHQSHMLLDVRLQRLNQRVKEPPLLKKGLALRGSGSQKGIELVEQSRQCPAEIRLPFTKCAEKTLQKVTAVLIIVVQTVPYVIHGQRAQGMGYECRLAAARAGDHQGHAPVRQRP